MTFHILSSFILMTVSTKILNIFRFITTTLPSWKNMIAMKGTAPGLTLDTISRMSSHLVLCQCFDPGRYGPIIYIHLS